MPVRKDIKNWLLIKKAQSRGRPQQQYQMNYGRPNYAAMGQHKLEGGNYDSAIAAGLAGTAVGGVHQYQQVGAERKKIKAIADKGKKHVLSRVKGYKSKMNKAEQIKAKNDPAFAKRWAARQKKKISPKRAKQLKNVASTAVRRTGRSFMKHVPKSLGVAGVTAGGVMLAKHLWDRSRSGRYGRVKTAGDIMRTAFMFKIAAFDSQKNLQLKTRITPFRNDMKAKLKPPFKIEAPAVNTVRTGKASTGKIEGLPMVSPGQAKSGTSGI